MGESFLVAPRTTNQAPSELTREGESIHTYNDTADLLWLTFAKSLILPQSPASAKSLGLNPEEKVKKNKTTQVKL